MKSLKGRLLVAFLGIIAVLTATSLVLFFFNWRAVEEYRFVLDTMVAEYRLVHNTSLLIDAYNVQIQSAGTSDHEAHAQLMDAEQEIASLTRFLDTHISDRQSLSDYIGFKSSIATLVRLIDESLEKAEQGNIENYFDDYNKANKQHEFVRENGTTLIFSQLQYADAIQEKIEERYVWSTIFGLASLFLLVTLCLFFVIQFAQRLTAPLRKLTEASQELAGGNMEISMDSRILQETSEIRTLGNSFLHMAQQLKKSQANLQNKAAESDDRARELAEKLSEIERMNKLMVNRELKMVELKQEITHLRNQLESK
jgi:HAMP domain-containing protein